MRNNKVNINGKTRKLTTTNKQTGEEELTRWARNNKEELKATASLQLFSIEAEVIKWAGGIKSQTGEYPKEVIMNRIQSNKNGDTYDMSTFYTDGQVIPVFKSEDGDDTVYATVKFKEVV